MPRVHDASLTGSRWRLAISCFIAFALLVGSTGTPALGADAGKRRSAWWYSLEVRPDKNPHLLCVGKTITLTVRPVVMRITTTPPFIQTLKLDDEDDLAITGQNSKPAIASLQLTGTRTESYGVPEPYQGHVFTLTGIKEGSGTLTFEATWKLLDKQVKWKTKVNYQVGCEYKVGIVLIRWMNGTLWMSAASDVRIVADATGRYSGTGDLDWSMVVARPFKDCKTRTSVPPSRLDITGEMTGGLMKLHLAVEPTTFSHVVDSCKNPNHLTGFIKMPLESKPISPAISAEGGSVQQARNLSKRPYRVDETFIVTLEPIEESAQ